MGKKRNRKQLSALLNVEADEMDLFCEPDFEPRCLTDFTSLSDIPQKSDSPAKKRNKVRSKMDPENTSEVLEAIHVLSLKLDCTLSKISTIEKTTELTSAKVNSLATSVQQLLADVKIRDERLSGMEKEMQTLKTENASLRANIAETQRYSRRWSLKMHGLKETDGEDVRQITIDALAKVAPKMQDHLDRVVDVVHRLGHKSSPPNVNPKRAIVILFSMRIYRDEVWRAARNSKFLLDNNLCISELLSPEDKAAREKLWPKVAEGSGGR